MAARVEKSAFLDKDQKIYELCENIDAPQHYRRLALDLLESNPDVSNNIGQTSVNYSEAILKCLIFWRDGNGGGEKECEKLIQILRNSGLSDQADWLLKKQKENPKCISKDVTLSDLSAKIDGWKYYKVLGLKLVESEVTLSNMRGSITPPCYKEALYQCVIQWRNREGSSLTSSIKLREILRKHKLKVTIKKLEELEPALRETVDETDGLMITAEESGAVSMETGEPEAKMHGQCK